MYVCQYIYVRATMLGIHTRVYVNWHNEVVAESRRELAARIVSSYESWRERAIVLNRKKDKWSQLYWFLVHILLKAICLPATRGIGSIFPIYPYVRVLKHTSLTSTVKDLKLNFGTVRPVLCTITPGLQARERFFEQ